MAHAAEDSPHDVLERRYALLCVLEDGQQHRLRELLHGQRGDTWDPETSHAIQTFRDHGTVPSRDILEFAFRRLPPHLLYAFTKDPGGRKAAFSDAAAVRLSIGPWEPLELPTGQRAKESAWTEHPFPHMRPLTPFRGCPAFEGNVRGVPCVLLRAPGAMQWAVRAGVCKRTAAQPVGVGEDWLLFTDVVVRDGAIFPSGDTRALSQKLDILLHGPLDASCTCVQHGRARVLDLRVLG